MLRNKLHSCFHIVQCLLLPLAASQHPNATFLYPTGNETFNIMDTINVKWESNFNTSIFYTWVYDPLAINAFELSPPLTVAQSGEFSYNLSQYESRFSKFPADVWFELIYNPSIADHNGGVMGRVFTVTNNASASPVTYPTPTATPTSIPTTNNKGIKVATGLAITAVILVLLFGLLWFAISRRRIRRLEGLVSKSRVESLATDPRLATLPKALRTPTVWKVERDTRTEAPPAYSRLATNCLTELEI